MEQERLCTSCKHHVAEQPGGGMKLHRCDFGGKRSPVDGSLTTRDCWVMRATTGECGPDGKLWQPPMQGLTVGQWPAEARS